MKTNQLKKNVKKLRRDAAKLMAFELTVEQRTRLKDYCLSIGAFTTAFVTESLSKITICEAQTLLALADLERAQRCGPDYAD